VIGPPLTVNGRSRAVCIKDNESDAIVRQEVFNNRRFKSHFASCPQASAWRKKNQKTDEP
jgi:hypothetical protein